MFSEYHRLLCLFSRYLILICNELVIKTSKTIMYMCKVPLFPKSWFRFFLNSTLTVSYLYRKSLSLNLNLTNLSLKH